MKLAAALLCVVACSKAPKTIATVDGDVSALAADDNYLYVELIKLGRASIVRIPKAGGEAQPLIDKAQLPGGLAVSQGTLYWAETVIGGSDAPAIVISADEIHKAGGLPEALGAGASHTGHVMTARSSDGSGAAELAHFAGLPKEIALDDQTAYVLCSGTWPTGAQIDVTQGSILAIPRAGGAPRVLADHLTRATALGLDATSVYWTTNGAAWRVTRTGGTPVRATTSPPRTYLDELFTKTLVDGNTRYRAVNKDMKATITAE